MRTNYFRNFYSSLAQGCGAIIIINCYGNINREYSNFCREYDFYFIDEVKSI